METQKFLIETKTTIFAIGENGPTGPGMMPGFFIATDSGGKYGVEGFIVELDDDPDRAWFFHARDVINHGEVNHITNPINGGKYPYTQSGYTMGRSTHGRTHAYIDTQTLKKFGVPGF